MPTEPTSWERENAGKARDSFDAVRSTAPQISKRESQSRDSEMVKRSQPSLAEGPKPPGAVRQIVKRHEFDSNWREESRKAAAAARSKSKRVYEDFTRGAKRKMGR